MTGRMYPELAAKTAAVMVFVGFNLTFFPQFVLGYLGMPRRYHAYPEEFQVLNVFSTLGATVLGVGYLLIVLYLVVSLFRPRNAPPNPWGATGLEWQIPSPPITANFTTDPVVTEDAYNYAGRARKAREN
jgi:cytochrome c oxidase subunit 1